MIVPTGAGISIPCGSFSYAISGGSPPKTQEIACAGNGHVRLPFQWKLRIAWRTLGVACWRGCRLRCAGLLLHLVICISWSHVAPRGFHSSLAVCRLMIGITVSAGVPLQPRPLLLLRLQNRLSSLHCLSVSLLLRRRPASRLTILPTICCRS